MVACQEGRLKAHQDTDEGHRQPRMHSSNQPGLIIYLGGAICPDEISTKKLK